MKDTMTIKIYETIADFMNEHDLNNCYWGNDDFDEVEDHYLDDWFIVGYHRDFICDRKNYWVTATDNGENLTCFYLSHNN
jgi:hypothetical protein